MALALVWASCGMLLGAALDRFPAVAPLWRSYLRWIVISIPFAAMIYLAIVGAAAAYGYFVTSRQQEEQLATARLSALRMQLRPHFLFNTLNTALVVVRDGNTVAAAETLERLSELLREVIRTDRPNEIALRDELRFLEQYLAIEEVRFADRLRVTWSIDERRATRSSPTSSSSRSSKTRSVMDSRDVRRRRQSRSNRERSMPSSN